MQYYIMPEWVRFIIEEKGMTFEEVLDACDYPAWVIENFIRHGGPTRNISIIGSLCRALDESPWEFAKMKDEDGDDGRDIAKFMRQSKMPLDYDESHFTDESHRHRQEKEADRVKVEFAMDFEVMTVSRWLMRHNQEAYEVLAK